MSKKVLPRAPLAYPNRARGLNNFIIDRNLERYLQRVYPDLLHRQHKTLASFGAFCGGRLDEQAEYSDRAAPPKLIHDLDLAVAPTKRTGRVELNDKYKDCQQELYRHGMLAKCFDSQNPEPHMLAFLAQYMTSYTDISTGCPLAMTHPDALILATRAPEPVRKKFLPQFLRTDGKTMIGSTWATEWAGGSDVRGNTETLAIMTGEHSCILNGRNFFTSATGFDSWGAIKTVRLDRGQGEGIALVFVTRFLDENWEKNPEDRRPNAINVEHLKEKSGTEGLATAEVALEGATGYLVADEKNGLRVMMEALGCSRVHNAMAAAGVMHRAYVEAMCWASHRRTFGDELLNRPDIQEDLLKLKTEWLGGAAIAFEAAKSFDEALHDKNKRAWLRVVTALAKYRTAEKATECTALATEIVGGTGYTKDHPIERIHRDAMVLRVWEGPKHIQARELMHVLANGGAQAFLQKLDQIAGHLGPGDFGLEQYRLMKLRNEFEQAFKTLALKGGDTAIAGPRLLRALSTGLTYALLCDEAVHETHHYNDKTKLLVARSFYEENISTNILSLGASELHRHFNDVARGLPVPFRRQPVAQGNAPQPPKL